MSLGKAEAEFIQLCKEILALEKRLSAARDRAEKLAHYIEIAREHELRTQADAGEPSAADQPVIDEGQSSIVRLPRGRQQKE